MRQRGSSYEAIKKIEKAPEGAVPPRNPNQFRRYHPKRDEMVAAAKEVYHAPGEWWWIEIKGKNGTDAYELAELARKNLDAAAKSQDIKIVATTCSPLDEKGNADHDQPRRFIWFMVPLDNVVEEEPAEEESGEEETESS